MLTTLFCRQMEPHPVNHLNKIDRMKKVNNMVTFLLGSEIQVLGGIHDTAPDDVLLNSKYLTFITKKQNTISYLQEHSHTVTYSCYLKTSSPLQYNFPGWVGGILGQASMAKQKTGLPPPLATRSNPLGSVCEKIFCLFRSSAGRKLHFTQHCREGCFTRKAKTHREKAVTLSLRSLGY